MIRSASGAFLVVMLTTITAAFGADTSVTTVRSGASADDSTRNNDILYHGRVTKTKAHFTASNKSENEKTIPSKLDANIGGTGNTGSMSPIESAGQ
jgi:hypothetical protein